MSRWLTEDFDPQTHNARVAKWREDESKRATLQKNLEVIAAKADAAPAQPASRAASSACLVGKVTPNIYPLVALCRAAGINEPIPEYRFHLARKWRFDYAWPLRMVAVEIEGGIWSGGRHTRGKGFLGDMQKYNQATLLGWRVLRYAPDQLGQAITDLRVMFAE